MSQIERPQDAADPLIIVPTPEDEAAAYAAALVSWAGEPPDLLFPRLKKEAKGVVVSFRLPESFERKVDMVTQQSRERGLPWVTRTDFLRDAAVYFAEVIEERLDMSSTIESLGAARAAVDRADFLKGLRAAAEYAVKWRTDIAREMLLTGFEADARREIVALRATVRGMTEAYVRKQWELALGAYPPLSELTAALEGLAK